MWKTVTDKREWNDVVAAQPSARFLQSWEWGEFQKTWGREVKRLSYNNEVLVQAIKMPLPLNNHYWYIPHGPVIINQPEHIHPILWELEDTLNDGALFYRLDPIKRIPPPTEKEKQERDARPLTFVHATQPQCTRILNLNQSQDELLAKMHPKTRYNIRLAEKKGVQVRAGSIREFLDMYHQTADRDKFAQNPDAWLESMSRNMSQKSDASIAIWIAVLNRTPLAGSMTAYFGDTATYLHGASSNEHRNVMAPSVLHWRIMQEAQKQHIKHYDFRGINPNEKDHWAYKQSWEGITRFKSGFGGELVCYPYSFDVTFKPWLYRMYTLVRKLR
ncbi:MAG: peptidoglycan bridge formation glycyltransferase FemA/FemB family protein [Patescibacteria group bacterium]|nr:peptidoglycan bridge formation glycyltransferase FemA/FemB family protein [Patescibacteria group bacterium]